MAERTCRRLKVRTVERLAGLLGIIDDERHIGGTRLVDELGDPLLGHRLHWNQ
jgi:hypothetical protein